MAGFTSAFGGEGGGKGVEVGRGFGGFGLGFWLGDGFEFGMGHGERISSETAEFAHSIFADGLIFAGLESFDIDISEANTAKTQDGMPDGFAHTAYFAVAAFGEGDLDPSVSCGCGVKFFNVDGLGQTIVEFDAIDKLSKGVGGGIAAYFGVVGALDLKRRVHQGVGEFTVVGEQEQAFGFVIKTPDRKDTLGDIGEQFGDDGASCIIGECGKIATGLVESEVDKKLGRFERFVIDKDLVLTKDRFFAEGCGLSVDGDTACADQGFGFAPRGDSCAGEEFL